MRVSGFFPYLLSSRRWLVPGAKPAVELTADSLIGELQFAVELERTLSGMLVAGSLGVAEKKHRPRRLP